jgi:acetyltransferase-like isoleucine patch superfamily enzyme
MFAVKPMFRQCGADVIFHPFDSFTYSTISIGDHVFIGKGAVFLASDSAITIGNKVMFGPCVLIMGGDHNTSEVGRYMIDVKRKRPSDDLPVVIEDDVWIGAGAIILKGVTIGRGSIVAAGSVVTRSIPEFSVAAGVPARVIKPRFRADQLENHKLLLTSNI